MYWNLKRVISILVITGFVASIFYYAYFQSRGIISGPQVKVLSPENGKTYTEPLIHVYGTTERAKEITLDGREIFIDLDGNFGEELLLSPGYNIIEVAARDTDGHSTKQTLEVVYDKGSMPGVSSTTASSHFATSGIPINN